MFDVVCCCFLLGFCVNDYYNILDCYYDYFSQVEDIILLSLLYWKFFFYNIFWFEVLKICLKLWCYYIVEELNQGIIRGLYNIYEGGGYFVVFGYNVEIVNCVLKEIFGF